MSATLLNWVKRRDSPLQRRLWQWLRAVHAAEFPVVPGLHSALLQERELRQNGWRWFKSKFYYQPLLRVQCKQVGRRLELYDNIPKVLGDLHIHCGDHVRLEGDQVWMAAGRDRECRLVIGDRSYLGYDCQVVVGTEIRIGKDVLIANRVLLNGFDGHPLDPLARARHEPPGPEGFGPIVIEDYAWIGSNAVILKDVRIGRGAVVAAGAVVTRDVPELTVVAGNPAKPIRSIEAPLGWNERHP